MEAKARLKRRMLSAAVAENVALIEGRAPAPRRSRSSRRLAWTLAFLAGAAIAAAVVLIGGPWTVPLAAAATARTALPVAPAPAPSATGGELTAPTAPPLRMAREVFPLALRTIVLDPGHGGGDLGTSVGGLYEKDLTLDLARRLRRLLLEQGFSVHLTRDADTRLSLRERARLANDLGADLFLSIHLNWFEGSSQARGVETYYLGPTNDPYLTQLASAENAESGYSRADIRHLLEGIYRDLRQEESLAVASSLQQALHRSLSRLDPKVADRGVKQAPFLVLVATEMPAVLAEVSCLSNREEARLLTQTEYRDRIAEALLAGVRSYAEGAERAVNTKRSG